jgi:hypothetical protein
MHWTFEDRSGNTILDTSGNGRDGTMHGGTFIASPIGEAASLDGIDDWISFVGPRDVALYGGDTGHMTVSARVRFTDLTHKANELCFGCGPMRNISAGGNSRVTRAGATLFDTGGQAGVPLPVVGAPILAEDRWFELTLVVQGGEAARLYVDDELNGELVRDDIRLSDPFYSAVGQSAHDEGYFGGEIDQLRIWNRALTDEELVLLAGRPAPLDYRLRMHWTFDDHDGDTIFDVSGNGYDGTLHGGSLVASPEGEAVSLDGVDDYISLVGPRDPGLYGGTHGFVTVSSRLRVTNVDAVNTLCFGCGPFNSLAVGNAAGGHRAWAKLANIFGGFAWPMTSSSLSDDTWVEVTFTFEGEETARLYLDCELETELDAHYSGLRDHNYSSVGQGSGASNWFGGEIDNLRIWDRILPNHEIAQLCP